MAKIDKAKEYIGISFWLGIFTLIILTYSFGKLSKYTHKKIDELEEL